MKNPKNFFKATLYADSANEAFARILVAAFASQLDPSVEDVADIKTAVSEAVTNCIVHAYRGVHDKSKRKIYIEAQYDENGVFRFSVKDNGCGIDDIAKAKEPLYTTDAVGERSGMGFCIMESFTDSLRVYSKPGHGTKVVMTKKLECEKASE